MSQKISTRKKVLGEGIKLDVETIHHQFNFLQGRVLTIIEASLGDKNQLKAVKDLLKNEFSNQMMYVEQLCYPDVRMLTYDQAKSTIKDIENI